MSEAIDSSRVTTVHTPSPEIAVYRDLQDDVDTIQDGDEALQDNGEWEVMNRFADGGKYVVGKTYFADLYVRMRRKVVRGGEG